MAPAPLSLRLRPARRLAALAAVAALALTVTVAGPAAADEPAPVTSPTPAATTVGTGAAALEVPAPATSAPLLLDVSFADGEPKDLSSNNYRADIHGKPVFSNDPVMGDIFSTDGTDDAVAFRTEEMWGEASDAFTMECVFRINRGMDWSDELSVCSSKQSNGLAIYAKNGEVGFMAHIGGEWARVQHTITGHHWYHVAATYDGAEVAMFIDGQKVAASPATGELSPASETARHFVIGADSGNNGTVQLHAPPSDYALARFYGGALTETELQEQAAAWAVDDCTVDPDADASLDEQFCGDSLAEDFDVHSGDWSVSDSHLVGSGERQSASRLTFGAPLTDYRLDARIRFDAISDADAWLAVALDIPADGSEPWQHAGIRANTTESNSAEFARRNADSTYTVTDSFERSPATPLNTWVDVSFVVRGNVGQWWYNGVLVGESASLTRSADGVQGLIVDGATISFDRITVTELEPVVHEPVCIPLGDNIRQPGQPAFHVGHRGTMVAEPENTIQAFQYAIDNGAKWVELDILWTKDEEIVVLHDETVDRTHEGTGPIKNMTLEEFKALDVKGHPGLKSPTFEEVLVWMKETGAKVTIEYKGTFPLHLAQKTADLIREYDLVEQSAALSFDLTTIERMREVMPELPRHINLSETPSDPLAFAKKYDAASLTWRGPTPPADVVAALHEAGVKLNTGTNDNPVDWEAAARLGVDGVTVNDAAAYAAWLPTYIEKYNLVECGLVTGEQSIGGDVVAAPGGQVLPGESVALTAVPAEGYQWTGVWVSEPAGLAIVDGAFTMPEGDVTVAAEFEPIEYALTYSLSGGAATGNPTNYTVESDTITLVAPAREGHEFIGWAGTGFEGILDEVVIDSGSSGNRHFHAVWESVAGDGPTWPHTGTVDVYSTPGFHDFNDRWWLTTCEPYSQTMRCNTQIWATQVSQVDGQFVSTTGWAFNNLTYLPLMSRDQWSSNPLGHDGEWTATDGRKWRTECDTEVTGRNGCRSYAWSDYVASTQAADGTWTHGWTEGWVFNNMVRFHA